MFLKTSAGIVLVIIALLISFHPTPAKSATFPKNFQPVSDNKTISTTTQSSFSSQIIHNITPLPKQVIKQNDADLEIGTEQVVDPGSDGQRDDTVKITYYQGQEYDQEVIESKVTSPTNEVLLEGTKIVWHDLDTPDGDIKYWKKIRVWATDYDSHCRGCNDWTATGMRAGKGVIAVDPSVITLGSKVYISGYGQAVAGDTGGAVKGNKIDLGFDDAKTSGWTSRYVDIYLL